MALDREIHQFLQEKYQVVTSTQGLARHLEQQYALQQIEQGQLSWETPKLISFSGWCQSLWQEWLLINEEAPLLLNQHQSLALWQELISSSRYAKQLLQVQATARQAQAAYQLCKSWQLDSLPEDIYLDQDAFAFKSWMESYELRLNAKGWLDDSNLPDYLLDQSASLVKKMERPVFYGFDEFMPQQQALIDGLKNEGCVVQIFSAESRNENHYVMGFQDGRAELKALADWIISRHKEDNNAQIGVLVPNIRRQRNWLVHELEKQLCIENLLGDKTDKALPFTVSIGQPLADYPMVFAAFSILQLNAYGMNTDNLGFLLRSPFIKSYFKEASNRSLFDSRIKKTGQSRISFNTLMSIHDELDESLQCPEFMASLEMFIKKKETFAEKQGHGLWSRDIYESLKCFSWPGERNLDSNEYQTLEAWQKLLEQLAGLDAIMRPVSFQQAISQLRKIANDTSFQPQTGQVPIHIMSTAGASGMQFDHLWFMGLHDQAWPEQNQVNPFLPIKLQRELGIANATPESRLETCQRLSKRIVESAKEVILSYPLKEGDRELRPSPILKQYESGNAAEFNKAENYYLTVFQNQELEQFYDETGTEIKEGDAVSGGVSLFKDQAACPFRAFARHRLHAEGLNTTDIGLSAIDRGLLVHRALQLFWLRMKHSEQLRRASDSVLEKHISDAVEQSISEEARRLPETFTKRFTEIEQQRLCRLLRNWLQIESERETFSVKATEKGHHVLFNGITLHMRIDRIDELEDGRLVIIDYKTGQATRNAWEGDRPDEPQLPLYAVTSEGSIAALVFAKIKTGDLRFIGLADQNEILPNVKAEEEPSWADRFVHWKDVLNKLADEYRQGKATVEPKVYACSQCDLHGFCRIYERVETVEMELEG